MQDYFFLTPFSIFSCGQSLTVFSSVICPRISQNFFPLSILFYGIYQRFNDKDIRKKNYVYSDNGNYEGIFLVGKLVNPLDENKKVTGTREYRDQIITIVDQCARFSELGSAKYPTIDDLDSKGSLNTIGGTIHMFSNLDLRDEFNTLFVSSGINVRKVNLCEENLEEFFTRIVSNT